MFLDMTMDEGKTQDESHDKKKGLSGQSKETQGYEPVILTRLIQQVIPLQGKGLTGDMLLSSASEIWPAASIPRSKEISQTALFSV